MPKPLISVGQIIDQAWDHYRKHFVEMLSVSSWVLILAILYTVAFALYPSSIYLASVQEPTLIHNLSIILALVTGFIVAPILGFWIFAYLVQVIDKEAKGKRVNLKALAKTSWKKFLPLLLVNVLFTLLIFSTLLSLVPGFGLIGLGFFLSNGIIGTIGTILLILGLFVLGIIVIYWAVRYFFVGYAAVLDDQHGKSAFVASRKVVGNDFWPILLRVTVPKILYFIIFAAIQMGIGAIIIYFVAGVAGSDFELSERLLTILNTILALVITVLINPLVLITDYLIYESAKNRS
jgi:hypothetical protein